MNNFRISLLFVIVFLSVNSYSQNNPTNVYVSDVDKALTVHKIGVLPVTDNENGLYSRNVETKLRETVKNSHRFDLGDLKEPDPRTTPDDYENDPTLVKKLAQKNNLDALIAAKVNKVKKNVDITVDLFLASDGKLFAQETLTGIANFSMTDVELKSIDLYAKVIDKLPYKGLVLSRQGNRVTLDVGAKDGLKDNAVVSVEQILSIKRHPKFNFIVSSEKEILGKIKIVKADETLSFGVVLQEKERGIIIPDSKITGLDYVVYSESMGPDTLQPTAGGPDFNKESVSFGKNPKEWLPPKQPSFGKLGLGLGLGTFHNAISTQLMGSLSTDVPIYPQLDLQGEIWITPNWFVGGDIEQGVLSMSNPQSSSAPSNLGANNSHYDFQVGYKFLLQDDFFGPNINVHSGLGKYSFFIDASTPITYTSVSYSGLYLGIGGSTPITADRQWTLDVNLDRYISPGITETPYTSGASADSSATRFSLGGSHKLTNQIWIFANLDFEFYSTTFSGVGTRTVSGAQDTGLNASQTMTTLLSGVNYLF